MNTTIPAAAIPTGNTLCEATIAPTIKATATTSRFTRTTNPHNKPAGMVRTNDDTGRGYAFKPQRESALDDSSSPLAAVIAARRMLSRTHTRITPALTTTNTILRRLKRIPMSAITTAHLSLPLYRRIGNQSPVTIQT
ncbi:hypothetical protein QM646_02555 [Rhodococcus erythropolis]|nr:hypothetical protein [Rhodococcus erythropolis]